MIGLLLQSAAVGSSVNINVPIGLYIALAVIGAGIIFIVLSTTGHLDIIMRRLRGGSSDAGGGVGHSSPTLPRWIMLDNIAYPIPVTDGIQTLKIDADTGLKIRRYYYIDDDGNSDKFKDYRDDEISPMLDDNILNGMSVTFLPVGDANKSASDFVIESLRDKIGTITAERNKLKEELGEVKKGLRWNRQKRRNSVRPLSSRRFGNPTFDDNQSDDDDYDYEE